MKTMSEKAAKIIRIASLPPFSAAVMFVALICMRRAMFAGAADIAVPFAALVFIPLLAYPVSMLVSSVRRRGRDGQRALAFVFTFAGYVTGALYALTARCGAELRMVFLTYFFSVMLLILANKALKIKASGHASGVTGPCFFIAAAGGAFIAVCAAAFLIIMWASVKLKRHTVPQFLLGAACTLVGAGISWCVCFL